MDSTFLIFQLIKRSPDLVEFKCICYEVPRVKGLTDGILLSIGNHTTHLTRLCLRRLGAKVSKRAMKSIAHLANLEYLKLEQFDSAISDEFAEALAHNCSNLRFISFCGKRITSPPSFPETHIQLPDSRTLDKLSLGEMWSIWRKLFNLFRGNFEWMEPDILEVISKVSVISNFFK